MNLPGQRRRGRPPLGIPKIKREKRVTIKDVAEKAGVSIGAVSRVLHGRESTIRVSEPTAESIRQAAAELNYKRNRNVQALRSGRSRSITIAAQSDVSFATNPYYASLLDAIVRHASTKGYTVCLSSGSLGETISFEDSKGKFDGIVWLGTPPEHFSERDSHLEILPQVGIHLENATVPENVLNIKADEVQAIINYVGHLRVNDVTKIGLFASPGSNKGLLDDKQLRDLCKRLAIEFFTYKSLDEVPGLYSKAGLEAGIVWSLEEASELSKVFPAKGKKGGLLAIVADTDNGASSNFVFPIDEMCKTAVEVITSKIENPSLKPTSVGLPIPFPA